MTAMIFGGVPASRIFGDALPSNNPAGWARVAGHLDRFAEIVQGSLIENLRATVKIAEEATACLFCAVITAKKENLGLGFERLVSESKGRSFGARLIHWAMDKADIKIEDSLKVAWGSFAQQMSSTMEMLITDLEPALPPTSPPPTPTQVFDYIQAHGGMGKMHMSYMNHRRSEKAKAQAKRETREMIGYRQQREELAKEHGYATPEAYDAAMLALAEQQRTKLLQSKFVLLKQRLVRNGTLVTGLTPPAPGSLTIYDDQGNQYVISSDDETALLSCAAATI